MKFKIFIVFIFLAIAATSQNYYENGYFIKNDGTQVNCFIKPQDWSNNPVSFKYKISENSDVEIGKIDYIKEYGYGLGEKFIRATLDVDQSGDALVSLNYDRNPIFKEETLFIKVLLEGEASLYFTSRETKNRFYYGLGSEKIEQLIYKRYMVSESEIGKNEFYKQQLANAFKCEALDEKKFKNLDYTTRELTKIFEIYNSCKNSSFTSFEKLKEIDEEKTKGKFNLTIRSGITFSNYYLKKDIHKTGYRIGLEFEYMLPTKTKRWSVFIEPSYRNFEEQFEIQYVDFFSFEEFTTITIKKNSIDFITGPRHFFNVNEKSSIFVDLALLIDTNINSEIFSSNEDSYDKDLGIEFGNSFGLGYRYNKLSMQLRYNNYLSNFKSTSFVLGYNIL